jgi:hypothetical protein
MATGGGQEKKNQVQSRRTGGVDGFLKRESHHL